jgi:multidrug resistance protein, MATE family
MGRGFAVQYGAGPFTLAAVQQTWNTWRQPQSAGGPASAMQQRSTDPALSLARLTRLWRQDGWPTLRLAAPVMVARAGLVFMVVVDSLMAGRGGAAELAFLGQGFAAQSIMMMVAVGLLQGSMVLISQAYGAGEHAGCGVNWKAAMVVGTVLSLVFAGLFFLVEPVLRATGLDDEMARGTGRVSMHFAWGMTPILLYVACAYFLESIKRPMVGMAIMLIANVLNVIADGIVCMGWFGWVEPMGAVGAVATTSAVRWLSFIAILVYILAMRDAAAYGVFVPVDHVGRRVWRVVKLGFPIAIALSLEAAAISSLTFMAGHLGAAPAAAHQLTFSINGLMVMVAVGMSAATAVRVGHAVGASDHDGVVRAGLTGISLALIIMSVFSVVVLLLPETISGAYVNDPAVWAISRQTLAAVGLMVIIDGVMIVTMGALRGMGDVRWPALLHGIAFWIVGVPTAYFLAFPAGIGAVGLILGISLAMLASLILLGLRFAQVSARTIVRA